MSIVQKGNGWTFAQVSIDAITDPRLSDGALRVYTYLVYRSGAQDASFPLISTIADSLHVSERTVQRRIRELEEAGYVDVVPRWRPDGGQASNIYIVHAKPQPRGEQQDESPRDEPPSNPEDPPVKPVDDKSVTSPGDANVTTPVTQMSPIQINSITDINHSRSEWGENPNLSPGQRPGGHSPPVDHIPRNLQEWLKTVQEAKNKPAAIVRMVSVLFEREVSFGLAAKVAREVGGYERMVRLLWEASVHEPGGDPVLYVRQMARNRRKEKRRTGNTPMGTPIDYTKFVEVG